MPDLRLHWVPRFESSRSSIARVWIYEYVVIATEADGTGVQLWAFINKGNRSDPPSRLQLKPVRPKDKNKPAEFNSLTHAKRAARSHALKYIPIHRWKTYIEIGA